MVVASALYWILSWSYADRDIAVVVKNDDASPEPSRSSMLDCPLFATLGSLTCVASFPPEVYGPNPASKSVLEIATQSGGHAGWLAQSLSSQSVVPSMSFATRSLHEVSVVGI